MSFHGSSLTSFLLNTCIAEKQKDDQTHCQMPKVVFKLTNNGVSFDKDKSVMLSPLELTTADITCVDPLWLIWCFACHKAGCFPPLDWIKI